MQQQINFYTLLPKRSAFQLTRSVMLSTYSIVLLLLIFIYGVELRAKQHAFSQYTALNNQVSSLKQQLAGLMQRYPISDVTTLKKTIQALEQQWFSKVKMLNLLTSKSNFSNYLSGLASTDVQGIWFTEIYFNNPDQKIDLKGFALQSELVEKILAQLNAQPSFTMFKFEVQNITESPLPPSFEVSAKQEASI